MKYLLLILAIFAFMAAEACSDRVYTRNGTWRGSVVKETPSQIHLEKTDGSIIIIPRANIRKIECTAEEDAANLLSEAADIEEKAEHAYGSRELKDALEFYRRLAETAGSVRERAGRHYDEALEIKNRAESRAEELRESIREKDIFMADEAGPEDLLREKGLAFDAAAFTAAAGTGNAGAVALFLEAGMDADARTGDGMTALMESCRHGQAETAAKLLAAGADVSLRDETGSTALHHAMRSGNAELIQLIVDATHGD